ARRRPVASYEFPPVRGVARHVAAHREERYEIRVFLIEEVLPEDGCGIRVVRCVYVLLRQVARDTEHPFDITRHRDALGRTAVVGDSEGAHLDWIIGRHRDLHRRVYVGMLVIEDRVTRTMLDDIFRHLANRCRRRGPHVAGLVVAKVDAIAARIPNRIVVPWSYAIEKAALRPGAAAAALRDDKACRGIGDDIRPRRWRQLRATQPQLVLAGVVEESKAVGDRGIPGCR